MLDFILKDGKRLTLAYCENDDDYLNAKLWTENGEYIWVKSIGILIPLQICCLQNEV